jgi:hypothetical protein
MQVAQQPIGYPFARMPITERILPKADGQDGFFLGQAQRCIDGLRVSANELTQPAFENLRTFGRRAQYQHRRHECGRLFLNTA